MLSPRALLAVCVLTAPLTVATGCAGACLRVVMGCVCGALRGAVLTEPVVPRVCARLDSGYVAYGGAMRFAHARELDADAARGARA